MIDIAVQSTGDVSLEVLGLTLNAEDQLRFEIDPKQFFFKSFDAPSFVTFVASLDEWQKALVLGVAGSAIWDGAKLAPQAIRNLPPALARFAYWVLTLQRLTDPETEYFWGFPSANDAFPSRLKLEAADPELLATQLNQVSNKLPALKEWLDGVEIHPMTGLHLNLDGQKLLIEWYDGRLNKICRNEL